MRLSLYSRYVCICVSEYTQNGVKTDSSWGCSAGPGFRVLDPDLGGDLDRFSCFAPILGVQNGLKTGQFGVDVSV